MARRHPDWLKVHIGGGESFVRMKALLRTSALHTICEEAKCPNIAECFGAGTAVFLILGTVCTRRCTYCHVSKGIPRPPSDREATYVAASVRTLGLDYVVLTSVTRDDLPDGGAGAFCETIQAIRSATPSCAIEVLIPDFKGDAAAIHRVIEASPDVINHNIEVVERLFPTVRPLGDYRRSLALLRQVKAENPAQRTKSGLMVGLGETREDITRTLQDLRTAGTDVVTIGQYLQPTPTHEPIHRYYAPEEFATLRDEALALGFAHVESGPLVRSSYHAKAAYTRKPLKPST